MRYKVKLFIIIIQLLIKFAFMAANDIIYIPNQPVQFWKVTPTEAEIEQGMTSWANSAYHLRRGNCGFNGPRYCQPYSINQGDILTFQFKAATIGDNVLADFYTPIFSDNNTSVVTDQLVDSGATFQTSVPDAEADMFVLNTTTPASSVITTVSSETELDLFDDIFLATPEAYEVYPIKGSVGWYWNQTTDVFYRTTAANLGITFENCLSVGTWYKVTITVVDITSGELNIKLGNNIIATITSVGTHIVYGQCETTDDFIIDPENFIGSISIGIDVRELETDYTIYYFDLDLNEVMTDSWTESSDSLTIGNIFYTRNLASFPGLQCGNYILGIVEGVACSGEMIWNGNLEDSPNGIGWLFDDVTFVHFQGAIPPVTNKIWFESAPVNMFCQNTLLCNIQIGHEYTLQWDISSVGVTKTGDYEFRYGSNNPLSPEYDVSGQTGTQTLTFTATENSIVLIISATSEGTTFAIDNVSLVDNTSIDSNDMDGLSECLCICGDQDCTTLIKFSADQPTYGNYFDGTTDMYMRIQGRLRNLDPVDLELNSFKSTMENQEQPYANLQDAEEFAISHCPQWVHGALRVAFSHPKLYIDGVSYKRISTYSINWGDDSEMAGAVCPVARKNQSALRNNF